MRSIRWLVLGAALFACAPPPERADLVIRNATIVVGDGTVIENGSVVVVDGKIADVGGSVGLWRGVDEIDGSGKTVLPGLIDSHVHLLALASDSAESLTRFRTEQLPTVLSSYLAFGITTLRTTGDPLGPILEVRDEIRSGNLKGPRLLAAGPVLTAVDGHPATTVCRWLFDTEDWCRENLTRELPDVEAAREAVSELARAGVDFVKVAYENAIAAQLDLQILEAIVEAAESHDLKVVVHGIPGLLAVEAIGAGADGLVHVPFGTVDLQEVVEVLSESPISSTAGVVHPFEDPQGNLSTPYRPWDEEMMSMNRSMLELTAALWGSGSTLAFGTDTPMFEPSRAWFHEIDALLEAGLTPSDILVMATRNAAIALGVEDDLGTLETGKRADLVLVVGQPHVDLDKLRDVELVIKDGAVVVDRR